MLLDAFKTELSQIGLNIKNNNLDDIFELYEANEYFVKLSNHYPVTKEFVFEDIHDFPPSVEKEQKYYISIYNEEGKLAAVLDYLDKYSFQGKNNDAAVWIGLLQVNGNLHRHGLGTQVLAAFETACIENGKKLLQLGVIKENLIGLNFWKKQGFKVFGEKNSGEYNLCLMEKNI